MIAEALQRLNREGSAPTSSDVASLSALLVLLAGFSSTLVSFPATWNDARTHGYVVAVFSVWLLWRDRDLLVVSEELFGPAVVVALFASLIWLLATVSGIRVMHQAMLPVVATAWATASYGRRGLHVVGSAGIVFCLAIPFWEVLLSTLQSLTVAVNSVGVTALGLRAEISGEQIRFPFGTLEVAQSCAGLSYFMSALTISVIYGQLFLSSIRGRTLAIAVAVGLAIVSNWVRVLGLVIIGYRTRMQSPLMKEHATYGWLIFAAVMFVFFALASRIEQWDKQQLPIRVPANTGAESVRHSAKRTWTSTIAALLGPLVFWGFSAMPAPASIDDAVSGIQPASTWQIAGELALPGGKAGAPRSQVSAGSKSISSWTPGFSGESERRVTWLVSESQQVQVDRLIYSSQSQGSEMITGDNHVAESIIAEQYAGPLDSNLRMVRQAMVRTDRQARLVWYWYRVAGVETSSGAKAKLLEVVAFLARSAPSELIAVSTPCEASSCQRAVGILHEIVTGKQLPGP